MRYSPQARKLRMHALQGNRRQYASLPYDLESRPVICKRKLHYPQTSQMSLVSHTKHILHGWKRVSDHEKSQFKHAGDLSGTSCQLTKLLPRPTFRAIPYSGMSYLYWNEHDAVICLQVQDTNSWRLLVLEASHEVSVLLTCSAAASTELVELEIYDYHLL